MAKFNLEYGLKDGKLSYEIVDFIHLGEAMEEAQSRALKMLETTKIGQELKADIKGRFKGDPMTALGNFMFEAGKHIEYFAKEILAGESLIYLVSNQHELFEEEGFKYISIEESIKIMSKEKQLSLDTETTGLSCYSDRLLLLQIGTKDFQIVYDLTTFSNTIPEEIRSFLREDRLYLLQNAKFDLKFLFTQDVILKNVYDTFLVETILTNGLQKSGRDLKTIVDKYCGVTLDKTIREEFIAMKITRRGIIYGANDVKYLGEVREKQLKLVAEHRLQKAVDLDNTFVIVLAYTEYSGIKLDLDKWLIKTAKRKEKLIEYRDEVTKQLYNDGKFKYFSGMSDLFSGEMDCTVNWNSSIQVGKVFEDYGIDIIVHKDGKKSRTVASDKIKPQINDFTIIRPYLKYKEMAKEVSTYGESWREQINPITGRIHTTFKQINVTGRLSSGNKWDKSVNLQNLPADAETRACFIAEPGNLLIDADYSSQEQILMANFSLEPKLLDFYAKGFTDMHSYIAFLMYEDIRRCSLEDLTPEKLAYLKIEYPEKRTIAKNAGFAINYGGNGTTIAINCNLTKKEGDFVYNSYFTSFPDLKKYFDIQFAKAIHFGYIEFNPVTRRKYFIDKNTNNYFKYHKIVNDKYFWVNCENPKTVSNLYNAAKSEIQRYSQNYPSQGSAADITKFAAVLFMREILARGWWMKVLIVNQVHDEILAEAPEDIAEEVGKVLVECMKKAAIPFCKALPLNADTDIAPYWKHS